MQKITSNKTRDPPPSWLLVILVAILQLVFTTYVDPYLKPERIPGEEEGMFKILI